MRPLSTQSQGSFLTDLKSSPPRALFLGFTGAIPFCGLATMSLIFPEFTSSIVQAQQAYGACILSFLGAIHWGYALAEGSKLGPSWSTLSYSVSPSLIAWASLLLHPVPGLMTLCVGLAFALSKDLKITHFPAWYHALRKALSTLAVASLGFTGVVFYFHWTEKAFDMLMWKVRRESQKNNFCWCSHLMKKDNHLALSRDVSFKVALLKSWKIKNYPIPLLN